MAARAAWFFEDEHERPFSPPMDALSNLLADFVPPLKCAIFNACYSVVQAKSLSSRLPHVIACEDAISDEVAIEFCRGFYDSIGAGKDIPFSFKQGCRAVELAGYPAAKCPVML